MQVVSYTVSDTYLSLPLSVQVLSLQFPLPLLLLFKISTMDAVTIKNICHHIITMMILALQTVTIGKVVTVLVYHCEGQWFESNQKGPTNPAVEMGISLILGLVTERHQV